MTIEDQKGSADKPADPSMMATPSDPLLGTAHGFQNALHGSEWGRAPRMRRARRKFACSDAPAWLPLPRVGAGWGDMKSVRITKLPFAFACREWECEAQHAPTETGDSGDATSCKPLRGRLR